MKITKKMRVYSTERVSDAMLRVSLQAEKGNDGVTVDVEISHAMFFVVGMFVDVSFEVPHASG